MINVLFGVLSVLAALCGMWHWQRDLISFLRGFFPVSLFLVGLLAIVTGLTRSGPRPREKKADEKD